jgi:hypothetical protein
MVIAVVAILALSLSNGVAGDWRRSAEEVNPLALLLLLLLLCCGLLNHLPSFVGPLAICGGALLLMCDQGDGRYAAKKFATYHFLALLLYHLDGVFGGGSNSHTLLTIALCMLTAAYPFNSWSDSFFLRAPTWLLTTWLVLFRPLIIGFFLADGSSQRIGNCTAELRLLTAIALITLFFVPVLFFAKAKPARLIGRISCWQGGYALLFSPYFCSGRREMLTLFAVGGGILTAAVVQMMNSLPQLEGTEPMNGLVGIFERDYFQATFAMLSASLLCAMPVIFLFKKNAPQLPIWLTCCTLCSTVLPAIFFTKLYRLMSR